MRPQCPRAARLLRPPPSAPLAVLVELDPQDGRHFFLEFDEELRALRAALPARHFALELRTALGLAVPHARLRAAPLGLEPGALAAGSRGPPGGQVRGVKPLAPQQGADLARLPAMLDFAQDLLLVLGREPAPASLRRHFRIVGLHGERHRTLRDHPLQRTQKAGCLTYVGAEGSEPLRWIGTREPGVSFRNARLTPVARRLLVHRVR